MTSVYSTALRHQLGILLAVVLATGLGAAVVDARPADQIYRQGEEKPRGEPIGAGWQARGSGTAGLGGDWQGKVVGSMAALRLESTRLTPQGGSPGTSLFLIQDRADGRRHYAGVTVPGASSRNRTLFRRFCYLDGLMDRPMVRFGRIQTMGPGSGQMYAIRPTYASTCAAQANCQDFELVWGCWFANEVSVPGFGGSVAWEDIDGAAEDMLDGLWVAEPATQFGGLVEHHAGLYAEAPHPHHRLEAVHGLHREYRLDPERPLAACDWPDGRVCRPTVMANGWRSEWNRTVVPWTLDERAPRDDRHCGGALCWTQMEPWGTKVFIHRGSGTGGGPYIEPPTGVNAWGSCMGTVPGTPCCSTCVYPAYAENRVVQPANPALDPVPIHWRFDAGTFPRDTAGWLAATRAAADAWNTVLAPYDMFVETDQPCDWHQGHACVEVAAEEWDAYRSRSRRSGGYYMAMLSDGRSHMECGTPVLRILKAMVVMNIDMPTRLSFDGSWGELDYEWNPPERIRHPRRFVLAHEFGHALGLDHHGVPCHDSSLTDVMCPVRRYPKGAKGVRGLGASQTLVDTVMCLFARTPGMSHPEGGL